MSGCTFLKDIYGWVWLFGKRLWVGVSLYRIFVAGCDSLEHFYGWVWVCVTGFGWVWLGVGGCGWVWVDVTGCGWVWLGVTGCGWMGKMVKPKKNTYFEEHLRTNAFMPSYIFIIFLIIVDTIITFTTIEKCTSIV